MLAGQTTQNVHPIFGTLKASCFNFHLTGSRFFGGHRPDSDWDFFTQHEPKIIIWLQNNGFRKIHQRNEKYKDECCLEVWRYTEGPISFQSTIQIDVQLVVYEGLKAKAQKYIVSCYPMYKLYKEQKAKHLREAFWNMVFATVKGIEANSVGMNGDGGPMVDNWRYRGHEEQLAQIV